SNSGDEIWVVQGVYVPSVEVDADASGGGDPREVSFQIPSGVSLYGGFVGGEMNLADRDFTTNLTILSGDIGGDDTDLDGNNIAETTADLVGANAYHVIYTQSVSASTRLDGFIVTAGQADVPGFNNNGNGGGWLNDDNPGADLSSPQIHNCRFEGNFANSNGGGLYMGSFTAGTYAPNILDCMFSGNEAVRRGGAMYMLGDAATVEDCSFFNNEVTAFDPMMNTLPGSGGAIMMVASNGTYTACTFEGNSATGNATGAYEGGGGGAVYINMSTSPTDNLGASHPEFYNCRFIANSVGGNGDAWGGAVAHLCDGGNLSVTYAGCEFRDNTATDDGGAVATFARTIGPPLVLPPIMEPSFLNCTFHNNQAGENGGALYFEGFVFNMVEMMTAQTTNCILYGNTAGISDPEVTDGGNSTFSHSLIQGSGGSMAWDASFGNDGGNNIDADPMFTNPMGGDLTLMAGSPAIDAGDDAAVPIALTEDLNGASRIQGTVDMGVYETVGMGGGCDLPVGLTHADIGNTGGYPGSVCYNMGTYTVDASGDDIWWIKDGFHFIYRKFSGNGEIIVRVDDLGYNNYWDLAGIMMRASLSSKSRNVLAAVNAGGKAFMQRRSFDGGLTGIKFGGNGTTPKWLRLVRFGNWFITFKSNDGNSWTKIGSTKVFMPAKIYVGIATSTPLAGTPNVYTLSNLSIDGVSYKTAPEGVDAYTHFDEVEGPRPTELQIVQTGLQLFPNPATDHIQIQYLNVAAETVQIDLLDLQGRVVKQVFSGNLVEIQGFQQSIDVSDLAKGSYLLRLNGKEMMMKKITVL
ncbi:MAG: T9SS type A sorting domain-containing protein, partial [Bacteroidota bacterium]